MMYDADHLGASIFQRDLIAARPHHMIAGIDQSLLDGYFNHNSVSEIVRLQLAGITPTMLHQAYERSLVDASVAANMEINAHIVRTPIDVLSQRLISVEIQPWWQSDLHLFHFNQACALSDSISELHRIEQLAIREWQTFASAGLPTNLSLSDYRLFLDAAGLDLKRWPVFRPIEKRDNDRRLKLILSGNRPTPQLRRAMTLFYQYERLIRQIVTDVMEREYGSDWPHSRLPLCGCKDLLGKWKAAGGQPLDEADFRHYELIVGHPDHFEKIFSAGFDEPQTLVQLFAHARKVRKQPFHAGVKFEARDLIDLRVTFRSLGTGLVALLSDEPDAFE